MAARDTTTLTTELNKLKKNELIDIIVTLKVPVNVANPQVITYINKIGEFINSKSDNKSYDLVDNITCSHCDTLSDRTITIKKELDAVSKLTYHLEKRCQEQEDLIFLLKQLKENSDSPKIHTTPSSSTIANFKTHYKTNLNIAEKKKEEHKQNFMGRAAKSELVITQKKPDVNKQGNSQTITKTDVSKGLLFEQSRLKMDQFINLAEDEKPTYDEIPINQAENYQEWKTVRLRQH
uniref:Uncharacterized protein LOC114329013 n=1 Tax=Diabrotica virgifera virgifera TaxID=50390 RepID=A0A6P7FFZ3_DIAVI